MKKVLSLFTLVLCVIIIINLVSSIYSLWKKQDLISQAKISLEKEKAKNQALQKQLQEVKKPEYIEALARNKLFMAHPNEAEILIPKEQKPVQIKKPIPVPIWKKWLTLFFGE